MAQFQPDSGSVKLSNDNAADTSHQTRTRPMHKFLHEWRVITRHPELDSVRNNELRWTESLDGRPS